MPDLYLLTLTGLGGLVLLVAWLPVVLRAWPLSLPIIGVAIGYLLFSLPLLQPPPRPLADKILAEHVSELVVIVALMGAGLRVDRPFSWRGWSATLRLLAVTMPLSIAAVALLGWLTSGLSLAAALLLGSALAPTDPVLASDVQVGPPRTGEEDEVRFALTAEAGLNDGLAFPFVALAIAIGAAEGLTTASFAGWLAYDVLWRIGAGVALGWLLGRGLGWLAFHLPSRTKLAHTGDGLIALGMTLVAYGLVELAGGYGFLGVFVTALAFRTAESEHQFHSELHEFAEQIERLLLMMVLVLFGGALAGGLLAPLTWGDVALSLVIVLVVRPLAGWTGLAGWPHPHGERALIAFFGIRGIGSFYYMAYAFNHAAFAEAERLWSITGLVVLISITLHGITVTPLMSRLDQRLGAGG